MVRAMLARLATRVLALDGLGYGQSLGRFIAEDLASRFLLQLESGKLEKPDLDPTSNNVDSNTK
ncbi:MAG: hypothetical protein ABL893_17335 [Hyphomicrobium sp.]